MIKDFETTKKNVIESVILTYPHLKLFMRRIDIEQDSMGTTFVTNNALTKERFSVAAFDQKHLYDVLSHLAHVVYYARNFENMTHTQKLTEYTRQYSNFQVTLKELYRRGIHLDSLGLWYRNQFTTASQQLGVTDSWVSIKHIFKDLFAVVYSRCEEEVGAEIFDLSTSSNDLKEVA